MSKSANIAIFGGSFDPPHNGHLLTISHLLNASFIDEVWLLPCGDGRYDKAPVESGELRLSLLEEVIRTSFKDEKRLFLKADQVRNKALQTSYAIDIIRFYHELLQSQQRDIELYYIVGADNITTLSTWRAFDEIIELATFLVVPRLGYEIPKHSLDELGSSIKVISPQKLASFSVSSTEIRRLLKAKKSLSGYLPSAIFTTIREKGLYGCEL